MILHSPIIITSRLLAGVQIGNGAISIGPTNKGPRGYTVFEYFIDIPGFEHHGADLGQGCGGGSVQDGLVSLLAFLGACAESYRYSMSHPGKGENLDLFPIEVAEWAYINSDEITSVQLELEETGNLIEE